MMRRKRGRELVTNPSDCIREPAAQRDLRWRGLDGQEVGAPAYFAYSTTLVCTSMHPDRDEHPLAAVASLKGYEEASELLFEAIRISAAGCCLFLMIFDVLAVAPCH